MSLNETILAIFESAPIDTPMEICTMIAEFSAAQLKLEHKAFKKHQQRFEGVIYFITSNNHRWRFEECNSSSVGWWPPIEPADDYWLKNRFELIAEFNCNIKNDDEYAWNARPLNADLKQYYKFNNARVAKKSKPIIEIDLFTGETIEY